MFEIGSSLREARMRQGLEIADAEAATKVRSRHLEALEDERFDLLPAQAYVKGFLRVYADYLGLDGQLYVDEFTSRFGRGDDDLPTAVGARPRPRPARQVETAVILVALAGIAAVTGLVVAAWTWGGSPPPREPNLAAPPPAASPAPDAEPRWVSLEVTAQGGSSSLVVRRGSRTGRVLFDGTLEPGRTMSFVGPRVWVSAGAPQHLRLRLDRRDVQTPRAAALLAGPNGVRPARAG